MLNRFIFVYYLPLIAYHKIIEFGQIRFKWLIVLLDVDNVRSICQLVVVDRIKRLHVIGVDPRYTNVHVVLVEKSLSPCCTYKCMKCK